MSRQIAGIVLLLVVCVATLAAAEDGGKDEEAHRKVLARATATVLSQDDFTAFMKKASLRGLSSGHAPQVVDSDLDEPEDDRLGEIEVVLEAERYKLIRREVLLPPGMSRVFRLDNGYACDGEQAAAVYSSSGKRVAELDPGSISAIDVDGKRVLLRSWSRGTLSSSSAPLEFHCFDAKGKLRMKVEPHPIKTVPIKGQHGVFASTTPDSPLLCTLSPGGKYVTLWYRGQKPLAGKVSRSGRLKSKGKVAVPDSFPEARLSPGGEMVYWEYTKDGEKRLYAFETDGRLRGKLSLEQGEFLQDVSDSCVLLKTGDNTYQLLSERLRRGDTFAPPRQTGPHHLFDGGKYMLLGGYRGEGETVRVPGAGYAYDSAVRHRVFSTRSGKPVCDLPVHSVDRTARVFGDRLVSYSPFSGLLTVHDLKTGLLRAYAVLGVNESHRMEVELIEERDPGRYRIWLQTETQRRSGVKNSGVLDYQLDRRAVVEYDVTLTEAAGNDLPGSEKAP